MNRRINPRVVTLGLVRLFLFSHAAMRQTPAALCQHTALTRCANTACGIPVRGTPQSGR